MTAPEKPAAGMPANALIPVHFEYTSNLAELLTHLQLTLLVSTYQAGKVLTVGVHQGKLIIAPYNFEQAMGIAVKPPRPGAPSSGRLAVGTRRQVWVLRSAAELAARIDPPGQYDACFLTRTAHFTGTIQIHEMAWVGEELWAVNTLFSCLSTISEEFSFVPRWRPPFVSALAGEDRCHLNGMAIGDGMPRYVTVLGESDTGGGWRPDKAQGGCVLEVPSGSVVGRGFAMPHSPRLHDGRLFVLDSGHGRLAWLDTTNGKAEPVAHLNGYTRGLALFGRFAFVGLSKIRETAVFGGVPIAERREQLECGVEIVDLQTGRPVGGLKFKDGVDEIFDVRVMPGVRCPVLSGPLPEADRTSPIWLVPQPR
jgi:uncharacterized protein (TIGR03032 family)